MINHAQFIENSLYYILRVHKEKGFRWKILRIPSYSCIHNVWRNLTKSSCRRNFVVWNCCVKFRGEFSLNEKENTTLFPMKSWYIWKSKCISVVVTTPRMLRNTWNISWQTKHIYMLISISTVIPSLFWSSTPDWLSCPFVSFSLFVLFALFDAFSLLAEFRGVWLFSVAFVSLCVPRSPLLSATVFDCSWLVLQPILSLVRSFSLVFPFGSFNLKKQRWIFV